MHAFDSYVHVLEMSEVEEENMLMPSSNHQIKHLVTQHTASLTNNFEDYTNCISISIITIFNEAERDKQITNPISPPHTNFNLEH